MSWKVKIKYKEKNSERAEKRINRDEKITAE